MPFLTPTSADLAFMRRAYEMALKSFEEAKGVPVGAVLVEAGEIVAEGHNRRVQDGDPTAHGEIDCLRRAGRRRHYRHTTLYTSLSPCMMCSGAILQFGIERVVVGEDRNFEGHAHFLAERGVAVALVHDPDCIALMARFIKEHPEVWNEDIAEL